MGHVRNIAGSYLVSASNFYSRDVNNKTKSKEQASFCLHNEWIKIVLVSKLHNLRNNLWVVCVSYAEKWRNIYVTAENKVMSKTKNKLVE